MSRKIKHKRRTFFRLFIEYGFHLWLLIFLCNVVIFYSVRFFIKASAPPINIQPRVFESPSVAPSIPTPIPTGVGPVIDLSFSLPGIGTSGGNLKPSHLVRDVIIYLYNSDSNTSDKTVKPVYTIKSQVTYDSDPNSSTYTLFANKYVDLGTIANEDYQIAIQTPQSLQQLIKSSGPSSVGGKLFDLSGKRSFILPTQAMITGDIYPSSAGDNIMDINDYNMLVGCFSIKTDASKCADAAFADLDDNGVVDGIDYNIMLLNFRTLLSMGLPVPSIFVPQADLPSRIDPFKSAPISKLKNPLLPGPTTAKTSPSPAKSSSGSAFGLIIVFGLFVVLGVVAFVVYKLKLLNAILHKSSDLEVKPSSEAESQNNSQQPQADAKAVSPDIIEKEGYLKKVSVDTVANGTWVTLADDNGITRGFVQGTNVTDGFVKVKGTMKTDPDDKQYILITEINAEE